jgi:sporulation protein YlmC with PRC-barrel domain
MVYAQPDGTRVMPPQTIAETTSERPRFITAQPANESLVRAFLGASVRNRAGEKLGDINDVMFDSSGRIVAVVIGIAGPIGMGEKIVAVPFSALSMLTGADGARTITMKMSRAAMKSAPAFVTMEKAALDTVRDRVDGLNRANTGQDNDLNDPAARQIGDMTHSPSSNF